MKLESPVKKFPGYVILPEYLTAPQVNAITEAMGDPDNLRTDPEKMVWVSVVDEARLPALIACVSEWHLVNIPEHPTIEIFPMSPMKSVHELTGWLFHEITKLWQEENEVPNG